MNQQLDLFVTTLQTFWAEIAMFVPKLLAALLLLGLGWLLARVLRAAVERLLKVLRFDTLAERSGLEALASAGGVNLSLSALVGSLAYWLAILVVAVSVASSLGLTTVAELLNRIALYLPNVLVAVLVLLFGTLLARFVNRLMFTWLNGIKAPNALTLSTGAEYMVQVFAFFLALEQLQIGTQLVTAAFSIAFGGLVLALALSFGLGGREWAAEKIRQWSGR
ncbi:MAG: mechanosensitive ion channel family protein [Pseudomonadota bacterium]